MNLSTQVIAAIGTSGSGKTTTLEYLITNLTNEGYKIGAIKHIHLQNFTLDREGTNTWRYAKAGAKIVVGLSPHEIATIKKIETASTQIDQIIKSLEPENLDIIFIEGLHDTMSKRSDIPKIITAKDPSDLDEALKKAVKPILAIAGLVALNINKKDEDGVPYIKIPSDGPRLLKIVKEQL
ncbi:MAG: molybdopterin-guanine dinucleotide biosynthesis protein B [Candidatus Bathyarchaeota archaeon]|nr:molybdopterin-guanine dinucleotide biosynthesis protein B [Candidatus Bathyarchaeota archaeon]